MLGYFLHILGAKRLDLCCEKIKLVLFTKQRYNFDDFSIEIDNHFISPSPFVKFLGMTLDYRFTFVKHFRYLTTKFRKILNVIKVLEGTWWGANPYTFITIYDALMKSCMNYGSNI